MRSGNLYSKLLNAKKNVKGSGLRTLLLAGVLLFGIQAKAQNYTQVFNTSLTSVVNGITVTVTSSGSLSGPGFPCGAVTGPYTFGGGAGSYTFTFSAPVGSVEIPVIFGNTGTAGQVQISKNGSPYTLTNANLAGAFVNTCGSGTATASGGDLVNTGFLAGNPDNMIIIPGPISSITVSNIGADLSIFGLYLTPMTYFQVLNTSGTSTVDGITTTVTSVGGAGSAGPGGCSPVSAMYFELSGGQFNFSFSSPVDGVNVPILFGDGGPSFPGTAHFDVNGSGVSLTSSNINGAIANDLCTPGVLAVVSGGDLTNTGHTFEDPSANVMIPGPITTFSVSATNADDMFHGLFITAGPAAALSYNNFSPQSLTLCQGVSTPINSLLAVTDMNSGLTLTWTVVVPPTNGTLTVGGTQTSTGGSVTPTGFSYQPTLSYSGSDGFAIQVSDGVNTVTTVINVTVNPAPAATFTTAAGPTTPLGGSATYTTQTGESNYIWSVPGTSGVDYTITAGGTGTSSNTVSLTWLTSGTKIVTVNYTNGFGCTAISEASSTTAVGLYCTPGTDSGCFFGDQYSAFTTSGGFTNITDTPGATCKGDPNGVGSFSGPGLSASAAIGTTVSTLITNSASEVSPGEGFAIWIDWNQDHIFQGSEEVYSSAGIVGVGATDPGSFTVPAGAVAGPTTLRIRSHYNNTGGSIDPCTFYPGLTDGYGISFDFPFTVLAVSFVNGSPQPFTVCKNAAATPINSLLTIEDPTPGLTETWSVTSAPIHGTLGGFPATATSTGVPVTPSGLTYTPTAGFAGVDQFVIQISDGAATSLTTVNVTVSAPNVTTLTLSSTSVCPGTGTVVTVSSTLTDGTYTVNYTISGATSAAGSATLTTSGGAGSFTTSALLSGSNTVMINSVTNASGCTSLTSSSTTSSTLPVPNPLAISGGGNYCTGGTGPNVLLAFPTQIGVNYQLFVNGTPTGAAQPGTTAGLTFGPEDSVGTYTIIGTNVSTGCTNAMCCPASVNIGLIPLPTQFAVAVTNSGHYCFGGGGVVISMPGSTGGVNYQLFRGVTAVGTVVGGTGSGISFPAQTIAGTYSVQATNGSGCQSNMLNTVSVVVDSLPTAYTVTGSNGGHYCSGGAGDTITLSNSDVGISYQLIRSATNIGAPVAGTGSPITFPLQTTGGSYTVFATNTTTTCTNTMSGSAVVTVDALPAAISGSLSVCVNATTNLTDATGGGTWISSTPAVATIGSGSGIATGVSTGTSNITFTVTASGCSSTAILTVNPIPTPITFVSGAGAVCVNSSINLNSTPGSGAWSSSSTGIATVTAGGAVTGASAGLVTISYTLPVTNCFVTTPVTVNPLPAAIGGPDSVCAGSVINLTDATGSGTWSSNNTAQATVTVGGNVTGVSSGVPTISYTLSTGCASTLNVTVNSLPNPISGSLGVCQGSTTNLSDASGSGLWTSSNTGAATVGSSSGIVSGVAPGNSTITFTLPAGGCTASAIVTVNALPATITGAGAVCIGGTIGLSDPTPGGIWSSGNLAQATVGSSSGIVTGVASGTPTIIYSVSGCLATTTVTVSAGTSPIGGIPSVCVGLTTNLSDATPGGAWTSSNTSTATVGTSGIVTGVAPGTSVITYSPPSGCPVTVTVTVNALPAGITGLGSVCVGSTIGLSDATAGGAWSSSDNSKATVTAGTGVVSGVAPGTPTIIYTSVPGCTASVVITVNPAPATITGAAGVCVGLTTLLVDGSSGGTWSSSNTALATVGTGGIVSAVSQGVPIISYTLPTGCFAVYPITVNPIPANISGATSVCTGSSIGLSDASAGGIWSSSNGTQATVGSSSGVVTGLAATTTPTITYTLPTGCITTLVITVNPTPVAIAGPTSVCIGSTISLTDATGGGAWSSSNSSEATIDPSTGAVLGVAAGTPTITYTTGTGCFTTSTITVNPLPASITGSATVCTGATVGLGDASAGGTWASTNSAQATVGSSSGVVTGVSAGNPSIIYTLPTGCTTTLVMTVNATPPGISGPTGVCIGSTITLNDATSGGAWTSSNTSEATVSGGGGVVGGVAVGAPIITYTQGGCFTTYTVTVNPLPSSISGPTSVCVGSSITLTDAGGGTWSSTAAATVGSASGVVTGVAPGTAIITYTLPTGCITTVTITVNTQPAAIGGPGAVCVGSTVTLTDASPGGTWASSNTALATVGTSGVVGGVAAGTSNITYTLTGGCFVTIAETVNPLPAAISGASSVCEGSSIALTDAGGGTWLSSNPAWATVGSATGIVTGVLAAGNPIITYTLPTGCTANKVITVNPQPAAITGIMTVCTGLTTTLADATGGGTWSSSNTALATVGTGGTVTGVASGTPNISYTLITGCFSIASVTVNSSPAPISGVLSVCVGLTTALGDATAGGTWSSSNTSQATVDPTTGIVTGVAPGNPNAIYTLSTGCFASANLTVNLTPAPISGTLVVCAGSTTTLTDGVAGGVWSSSNTAVATVGTGGIVTGVASGTATIAYTLGAGCSVSAVVTVNPIPNVSSFTAPTATNVCTGNGSTVTVNSTSLGVGTFTVTYNLSAPNTATALTAVLTMGPTNGTFTIPGAAVVNTGTTTVTITSIANSFGCSSNVSGTATLTTFPLPTVFIVGGGGGYCAGGPGAHVTLSGSLTGNTYQLFNGATPIGGPVSGTFSGLDFGPQTAIGTYTVVATNTTTGCTNNMSGSVTIFINPLPTAYAITGGGGYCFGGSGVPVGVSNSDTGVTYQLFNGASAVGGAIAGTGAAISFGLQTAAGIYTVVATRPATGCTRTMTGTATVVVNPVPSSISGTTFVCPGTTVTLGSAPTGGTWSSSTTSAATVDPTTGVVTGVAAGSTTITYSLSTGCFTTTTVTVNPLPAAITGTPNVCVGLTTTLADATGGGTWSSGNTLIANINISTGLVSGGAPGTTTMTYTLATGCTATMSFTVNPTPAAIAGPSSVCVGSAVTLTDATTGGTWSSSNPAWASVGSSTGIVTGASAAGNPTITYTLPAGCTVTAIMTVNPTPAGITGSNNVCTGVTSALADATGGGVWSSSNSAEATINSTSGAVTGVAAGTPTITYTLPAGCTALYPITVNISPAAITGVTNVCAGLTTTLSDATAGGTWSSSGTSSATVDPTTGVVTGVAAGTPNIIYTMPTGCTAITPFTVNPTPVAIGGVANVCVGFTTSLTDATAGGTWASSNTALATVGSTGTVTGVTAGTPTITYTLPAGCFASLPITVNQTPAAITGANNVCTGGTTALSDVTTGGIWTSSNPSVGSVGSTTGIVTGGAFGTLTITYTLSAGCTATFPMTVNPLPFGITGILNVCVASVTVLSDATSGGTWSSSNTALATVGTGGAVTGVAAGTPTINYILATGCSASTTVTVNPLPTAISGSLSVCTGATSNLSDGVSGGVWSSSNTSVATIDPSTGVVSGVISGNTIITYSLPTGCSITANVTVNPTPLAITGSSNVCVGLSNTLSDASGGGAWTSSNNLLATVGSVSGTVTGVATGTPIITYTLPAGCFAIYPITVNPTPANITGTPSACTGNTSTLADATVGGVWSSSNTSMATVGSVTGIVSAVLPGTPTITYMLPAGCTATVVFTVNPTPLSITGTMAICIGNTTTLADGSAGGTWSSSNTATATVGSSSGTVGGVAAGTVAITYTLPAGSCFTTAAFTVNPLPTPITGTNNVCVGNTVTLSSTPSGGTWSSSNTAQATVGSTTGVVTGIAAGIPNITYSIPTGCNAIAPVTVNALPTLFTVTGGGAYCVGGTGFAVSLSGSTSGINYQLMLTNTFGTSTVGSAVPGTGSALNFGVQSAAGTYTVVANNPATGCTRTMSSIATILVNPLPAQFNITGGGNYCTGGTGVLMGLNGSESGVNYQLFNTTTSTFGSIVPGTGSSISFGLITGAGTYIAIATNSVTSCTQNMLGTGVVGITSLPTAFAVTGGGSYCTGGTGVHIGVSGSQSGINYQLFLSPSVVPVATIPGTGAAIDFGLITAAGTYTIAAVGATTPFCTSNMTGSASVIINPLPTSTFTVTTPSGSSYCAGGSGVLIGLSGSQSGVNYQIFTGTTAVGSIVPGIGGSSAFNIGLVAPVATTTYSVVGTNATTGCSATMTGTATVTVNPLPAVQTVTGGGSYCATGSGVAIGLANSVTGVTYTLIIPGGGTISIGGTTGSPINFGNETIAGTYTVVASIASTSCSVNMSGSAVITINPLPGIFSITGGGSYCAGGTGVHIGLSGSATGITYQLLNGVTPVGAPVTGTGSAIDFGLISVAGSSYTVTAKNSTTLCTSNMTGTATVTITALPTAFAISGGGSYCAGGTGLHIGLANSTTGVSYQLMNGTSPVGFPVAGSTGVALDFGIQTAAGIYTVVATSPSGCINTMSGTASITINPLPAVNTVLGTGSYCAGGTGVDVTLNGSVSGNTYQLFRGATPIGSALPGTGSALDYGLITAAGTYTVTATSGTTGCTSNMAGSATVTILPLPTPYVVTGGGSYCTGAAGVPIGLSSSNVGITYQLIYGTGFLGAPVTGTGSALSFGLVTGAGNYTVIATNFFTGCNDNMSDTVTVTVNSLPNVYAMTGGGSYCPGGAGVLVGLTPSDIGVSYQLMMGTAEVGAPVAGTGGSISFGMETGVGAYTAVAKNNITGCTSNMAGTVSVATYPLPTAFTVTGGGTYCTGGAGVHVGLSNSATGVNYQLLIGTVPMGSAIGTGFPIDFGVKSAAGVYTVVATNATTGCTSNMTGSVTISVAPLPAIYSVTGGGSYCTGGTGVDVGMAATDTGVNYQLLIGTTPVGSPVAGTGTTLDFGVHTAAGIYTVVATNATSGCVSNMAGSATISINPLPAPYIVAGGGSYCAGSGGVSVTMGGSDIGINYQLHNGVTAVGGLVGGTSFPINFGLQTAAGTYTVSAINAATGCTINMLDSAIVTINPVPLVYTVSGGGSFCPDATTGIHIDLSGSDAGINYQLYNGATSVGAPKPGTGAFLDYSFTSVVPGNYRIVATNSLTACVSNMSDTVTITALPAPAVYNVTGGGSYCTDGTGVAVGLFSSDIGFHYQLHNGATPVGLALAGTGLDLNFGLQTATGTYTVVASNDTTGCTKLMNGSAIISTLPLPTAYTLTSSAASYCFGSVGVDIRLGGSQTGVNYQLMNGSTPVGVAVAGTGAAIDFGSQPVGTYSVVAANSTTSCTTTMSGVLVITVNPLPTAYTVTGGGGYCAGGTGIHIYLDGSDAGTNYQLYNGVLPAGTAVAGTGAGLDFGSITTAGTYTVIATNTGTGCNANMASSATITINPLPALYPVTGGGNFCTGGAGVHVGLGGSDTGVHYQLFRGTVSVGAAMAGTGAGIDFGIEAGPGVYTVVATNNSTGCTQTMTGSTTIAVSALPVAYAITGGGNYCTGGAGVHIGTASSDTGVTYQLMRGVLAVGPALVGTGSALDFGLETISGTYTVVATNLTTGCTANLSGSSVITISSLPAVFTVTGGGSYCLSTTGVAIGLSGSEAGVNYQLFDGSTAVGSAVPGTGTGAISLGVHTFGTYTVVATNATTGCTSNMTGSATITVATSVTPSVTVVTGVGDTVCAGTLTTFVALTVNGGTSPTFQWYVNGSAVGTSGSYSYVPVNGNIISVTMTSDATCASPLTVSGSVTMTVRPYVTPSVTIASAPGDSVCQGTLVTFIATPVFGGTVPTYAWYRNGIPAGGGDTFTYVPSDGDVIFANMTSSYLCSSTTTAISNNVALTVESSTAPVVSVTINSGATANGVVYNDTLTATVTGGFAATYQWSVNGVDIPGAIFPVYVAYSLFNNDIVACTVTNHSICGAIPGSNSVTVIANNVGVKVVSTTSSDIRLVPNPNKGDFTVKGSLGTADDEEVTLEVTDMLGQVIYKEKVMARGGAIDERIQLSSTVANGMYLLNMNAASGNKVFHMVIEQ